MIVQYKVIGIVWEYREALGSIGNIGQNGCIRVLNEWGGKGDERSECTQPTHAAQVFPNLTVLNRLSLQRLASNTNTYPHCTQLPHTTQLLWFPSAGSAQWRSPLALYYTLTMSGQPRYNGVYREVWGILGDLAGCGLSIVQYIATQRFSRQPRSAAVLFNFPQTRVKKHLRLARLCKPCRDR